MLNQLILVGRLTENPQLKKADSKNYCTITLAVNRSFKNADGIYETDIIPIVLWQGIAENTVEYCKKGDVIGVKGRIQTAEDKIQIIADEITFLSSKKEESDK
jgi:single-strand DNA-binding protein